MRFLTGSGNLLITWLIDKKGERETGPAAHVDRMSGMRPEIQRGGIADAHANVFKDQKETLGEYSLADRTPFPVLRKICVHTVPGQFRPDDFAAWGFMFPTVSLLVEKTAFWLH